VIENDEMKGKTEIANTELVIEFVATRIKPETADVPNQAPSEPVPAEQEKAEPKQPAEAQPQQPAEAQPAAEKEESGAKADDPVSGKWVGTFVSERGEQDVTMTMRRDAENKVTGSFESTRGEREFSGKYDPTSKMLTLSVESGQFEMTFDGKVEKEQFAGDLVFNSGQFTMTFDFHRESPLAPAAAEKKPEPAPASVEPAQATEPQAAQGPQGEKSLAKWLPGPRWVSSIEASRFRPGRCYITFDGHRSNDDGIYVFVTNDYGQTWESLKANLPDSAGTVHVLREDVRNPNVLYLGCEMSAWFSIDGGKSWTQMKGKFPTVAVHDFAVHPTAGELVAATHGRSLWIADINYLRQFSEETLKAETYLYQPQEVILWRALPSRGDDGPRRFVGENPPRGTTLAYSLGRNAGSVSLVIKNIRGEVVKTLTAPTTAGLHTVNWALDIDRRPVPSGAAGGAGRAGGGTGGGRAGQLGNRITAGEYLVILDVDGKQESRTLSIASEPQ
jgi:hypothetical protein